MTWLEFNLHPVLWLYLIGGIVVFWAVLALVAKWFFWAGHDRHGAKHDRDLARASKRRSKRP
jgi:hypothetical protein